MYNAYRTNTKLKNNNQAYLNSLETRKYIFTVEFLNYIKSPVFFLVKHFRKQRCKQRCKKIKSKSFRKVILQIMRIITFLKKAKMHQYLEYPYKILIKM